MRARPVLIAVSPIVLALAACAHDESSPAPASPASPLPPSAANCPPSWSVPPSVPPSLAPPDRSLRAVAHVSASGTQNYKCGPSSSDGGAMFGWSPAGPEANLTSCDGSSFGTHMASEAGAAAPKWQASDGSFVVAKKAAAEPSPEPKSVPWLLLQVTSAGGTGTLGGVSYVQRTQTKGGAAPADGCDATRVGAVVKVPYTADYWFLGGASSATPGAK